ncbi:MAG TPA: serine acetyltransferase [Pseudomonas sp.]|uniref:serine O-acetyltransferase n=1 Tax=Pseudomonas sp. TaxID=306 RepID=UPI002B7E7535|nr:serine acetyltransferase [Pseudomonas sp.]HRL93834.1 serine acetyltransferase [Pseudomonas sp.]
MNFIEAVKKDINKYVPSNSRALIVKTLLLNHSFHLVFWIRIGQLARKIPFLGAFLGVLVEYFIRVVFASDISCKAKIGGGLMIVHGHDVVIGSDVVIGENCKIFNGVTLGSKDTEILNNKQPIIKDHVVIGTGAKVLGSVTLGNSCYVGANSVVIHDIPCNSVAVGIPARIIKKNEGDYI